MLGKAANAPEATKISIMFVSSLAIVNYFYSMFKFFNAATQESLRFKNSRVAGSDGIVGLVTAKISIPSFRQPSLSKNLNIEF
jgi:hypothetical protein